MSDVNAAPIRTARPWIAMALVYLISSAPAAADWPAWLEPWLYNSTERTERGIESFEQGDIGSAVEPLETALRLTHDDPGALYNAGAARLSAGQGDAQTLLEAAAEAGDEQLAPLASYNLGNARLAAKDFSGAIEAYQQTLRLDPMSQRAKYNLELARRRFEEQQEQDQEQQQQEDQQQKEQQRDGESEQQQDQEQQDREQQQDQEQQQQDQEQPNDQERQQESPLPQFRDLPDMSAEEAAAILEAIENMEREQRRHEAQEAAKQHRPGKKDW